MDRLLRSAGGSPADDYMLLADFDSYRQATAVLWRPTLTSSAGIRCPSSTSRVRHLAADRSIRDYARDIWHVPPATDSFPLDKNKVRFCDLIFVCSCQNGGNALQ